MIYQSNHAPHRQLFPHIQKLKEHAEDLLGAPAIIDNDARMMAYGTFRFGNAAGHDCMAIVNLGHGLGLGLVLNGTVFQGYHGHAAELGHIPLGDACTPCHCGLERCLENVASGSGLERMARQAGITVEGRPATSAELAGLARQGHSAARALFERFAVTLAQGVGSMINLFNPQAVVLAGRVSRSADVFIDRFLAELRSVTYPAMHSETKIVVSDPL